MKKVVYWYGPRDITIVCTEIQIDRAIYFVCSKYYFILWLYEGNVNGMEFKYDTCILWLVHIISYIVWQESKLQFCVCQMKKYMHLKLFALTI